MSEPPPLSLPPGYHGRPAGLADIGAIHHLVATCDRERYGRVKTDDGGIGAVFARPGLKPETDTVLVSGPAGEVVAWAWVDRRSRVDVHPEHRGRGLGAALLAWVEARARHAGGDQLTQTAPDGDHAAVALLRRAGYQPLATNWLLGIETSEEPTVPEPPPGVTVRPFQPGDAPATYQLVQDAFDEWQQRRKPYQEWARHTVDRPTFAPAMSPVAIAGGQLVGVVLALDIPERGEGYLEEVAVHRHHRGRGIARLLLRHAFRACHRRGRPACTLWTHSDTGALPLYQRVG